MGGSVCQMNRVTHAGHGEGVDVGAGEKAGNGRGSVCMVRDAEVISSGGSWTWGLCCGHGGSGSGLARSRRTGRRSDHCDSQTDSPERESDLCFDARGRTVR